MYVFLCINRYFWEIFVMPRWKSNGNFFKWYSFVNTVCFILHKFLGKRDVQKSASMHQSHDDLSLGASLNRFHERRVSEHVILPHIKPNDQRRRTSSGATAYDDLDDVMCRSSSDTDDQTALSIASSNLTLSPPRRSLKSSQLKADDEQSIVPCDPTCRYCWLLFFCFVYIRWL